MQTRETGRVLRQNRQKHVVVDIQRFLYYHHRGRVTDNRGDHDEDTQSIQEISSDELISCHYVSHQRRQKHV